MSSRSTTDTLTHYQLMCNIHLIFIMLSFQTHTHTLAGWLAGVSTLFWPPVCLARQYDCRPTGRPGRQCVAVVVHPSSWCNFVYRILDVRVTSALLLPRIGIQWVNNYEKCMRAYVHVNGGSVVVVVCRGDCLALAWKMSNLSRRTFQNRTQPNFRTRR